jgi:energy-coupling factor transporter ATP-binding protein EcfA2
VSLELRGVRYRYAGATKTTLSYIDLVVEPGAVVGLVGANESGKTTLCLVASGLAPATIGGQLAGTVLVDGLATSAARPHELAQRCGVLFQNPATQLSGTTSTVWEEIAFGPRNLALPLDAVVERVEGSMAALGIAALQARDPGRLSGGQAQLVALAAVLAMRPAYLVLDEPTSQLDPQGTRLVGEALARLVASSNVGVLIAEHKTDLLARIAGTVAVLDAGALATSGLAADVLADPRLMELGVEPPSGVRLQRAADGAGVRLPEAAA